MFFNTIFFLKLNDKIFSQFLKYEKNYSKKNITVFQYFIYHSLKTYI